MSTVAVTQRNGALAWTNIAWLLSTCSDDDIRSGEEAIEAATKACKLTDFQEFKNP